MSDRIGRYVTDAGFAAAVVRCPATVEEVCVRQHGLGPRPATMLGEAIVAGLLLGTRLKGPGLLTAALAGEGAFRHFRVDAIGLGSVRAMVLPSTHEALAAWNGVDPLLSDGVLTVERRLQDDTQPYQSKLLVAGDAIPSVFNQFLVASEQVMAAIAVRVSDGEAVGVYVERLPGADVTHPLNELVIEMRDANSHPALNEADNAALLSALCPEATFRELHAYDVGFHCPCSRDRYIATLRGFKQTELTSLTNGAGVIETVCDFCRTRYDIPLDEVL
ncbi:MAG: Hsp33 family molecular chaperone HslO [Planctomycetota bacterium]|nr:Hsp33 family molecular chaperone HslO [Planctomycetota bacterium]